MARPRLYQTLYARILDLVSPYHESLVAKYKKRVFDRVGKRILELGPGTGVNFAYYPPATEWIGIESNPAMMPYLQEEALRAGILFDLREGFAEEIDLEDQSMDTVVATLLLCSVEDPHRVLKEIRRVLRPGGVFLFLEHVAAPRGTLMRSMQQAFCPVWRHLAGGCRPNRETLKMIREAGFSRLEVVEFRIPAFFLSPHIVGIAEKE